MFFAKNAEHAVQHSEPVRRIVRQIKQSKRGIGGLRMKPEHKLEAIKAIIHVCYKNDLNAEQKEGTLVAIWAILMLEEVIND